MREEIGERGSGTPSERFLVIFRGFEGILTVGAKEIIKNPPDPSSQTFKKPKNRPKRLPLEDAPIFLPSTVTTRILRDSSRKIDRERESIGPSVRPCRLTSLSFSICHNESQ